MGEHVREYEIGSEAWMRERIEHGLDPEEGDRPETERLLSYDPAGPSGPWAEPYPALPLSR